MSVEGKIKKKKSNLETMPTSQHKATTGITIPNLKGIYQYRELHTIPIPLFSSWGDSEKWRVCPLYSTKFEHRQEKFVKIIPLDL